MTWAYASFLPRQQMTDAGVFDSMTVSATGVGDNATFQGRP
ncbi:hypothetical protein [Candidatus Amarolinea dominans]